MIFGVFGWFLDGFAGWGLGFGECSYILLFLFLFGFSVGVRWFREV